ncbi:DUF5677 domain-containing protein [Dickeya solani]|uniref:DUF5677 domain-containing protein n=1 Tax=Dickeya solani TaxID=1089444 RepID=UPI0003C7F803|nr:DUF5677 domain-containing protein [Dickeya solani]
MKHNISKLNILIKDANEIISHIKTNEFEERVKIAISFFELFIQNNKSMILLIEGGFYNEALAIHRLSIEHFFNIFALIRKKDFLDIIKNSSSVELEKTAKILDADLAPNDYENINEDKKENLKKSLKILLNPLQRVVDIAFTTQHTPLKSVVFTIQFIEFFR